MWRASCPFIRDFERGVCQDICQCFLRHGQIVGLESDQERNVYISGSQLFVIESRESS